MAQEKLIEQKYYQPFQIKREDDLFLFDFEEYKIGDPKRADTERDTDRVVDEAKARGYYGPVIVRKDEEGMTVINGYEYLNYLNDLDENSKREEILPLEVKYIETDTEEPKEKSLEEIAAEEKLNSFLDKHNAARLFPGFETYLADSIQAKPVKTPFYKLNEYIGGGLIPGLYTIGAIPGLGKTTLCLQIANFIAENGGDVFFFTLEMSKEMLLAKSISHETYRLSLNRYGSKEHAKGAIDVLHGYLYSTFTEKEREVFRHGMQHYKETIAPNIHLFEKDEYGEKSDADWIKRQIKDYVTLTGKKPVVFVDYLQYVDPHETGMTDKQAVDYTVRVLKNITREFDIPVIAIGAFSRNGYREKNMSSFRDSSNIEYTSDVMLILDYRNSDSGNDQRPEKDLKLTIKKNRFGEIGKDIFLKFQSKYNIFEND